MSPLLRGSVLLAVATLVAFVVLSILVLNGVTASFDLAVLQAVEPYRDGVTGAAAQVLTDLGSVGSVAIAAAAFIPLWLAGWRREAVLPALALALADMGDAILKCGFQRPRPVEPWPPGPSGCDQYSFPSGHAMDSMALYGMLVLLVWAVQNSTPPRIGSLSLLLMPLMIGLSRVVLGVHWLTDVIGGWLAGMEVVILLGIAWYLDQR